MKLQKQVIAALAVSAMLFAQGGNVAFAEEKTANTITVTESWTFDAGFYPVLSPETSMNYGSAYWSRNFFQTLLTYDENGEITGELAADWSVSDDGLTYTFTLRDGVKFSDGSDLTSEDVRASIAAAIENLGAYNGSYGKLTSIISDMETPDESTFVMTLSQPYYGTLNDLTMSIPLAIVSHEAFADGNSGAYEYCMENTPGTGPYMYQSFEDNTYTFVSNPYYGGEKPDVESFQVKAIEDNDAKILALQSGEIDAILGNSRISYDGFADLMTADGFAASVGSATSQTRFLSLNLAKAPFDDAAVRKAVAYAVDQDTISAAVFNGIETAAETLFDPAKPYCDVEVTTYAYDPDQANALLDEAGYMDTDGDGIREKDGEPLELTLIYSQSFATLDDAVLVIADELKAIGMQVTVSGSDMMTWYGAMQSGEYDLNLYYTYGGAFDPYSIITNIKAENSTDPAAMMWAGFFEDGALIERLDSSTDQEEVLAYYEQILTTIADECLAVPVTNTHDLALYRTDKIAGYSGSASDPQYVLISGIELN